MRRHKRSNQELTLNIVVHIVPDTSGEPVATTITPIVEDWGNRIIDDQALADFNSFLWNIYEILDYYDFEVSEKYKRKSKTFPYTSEYSWIARREDIEAGDVPKYIHLRISDHIQAPTADLEEKNKKRERAEAADLKLPKTKVRQRFIAEEIVANGDMNNKCKTYEQALNLVEHMIFNWMEAFHADMSKYDPLDF